MLPYDPRDINEAPDQNANAQPKPAPVERTDNPALIFSAAQQDQTAKESPTTATVAEAHGAFTAALINALEVLPADAPASVDYQQVNAELEGNGIADQTPSLDAASTRRQQPLFGGTAGASRKTARRGCRHSRRWHASSSTPAASPASAPARPSSPSALKTKAKSSRSM